MRKAFEVAGHQFTVSLPDGSGLWDLMGQYAPFACGDDGRAVFGLTLSDSLPDGECSCVYDPGPEPGETVVRLFRQGGDWVVEMTPDIGIPVCAKLWMSADCSEGRLVMLTDRPSLMLFAVNNSLMLQYAFRTAGLGVLEMHASVIRCGGKGYLFLARSGTGKRTHSQLWLKNIPGSFLLNDDNPVVAVGKDGAARVYGSPWSGKTPCYINESCPVGAFVQIRRCHGNRITPLSAVETYALIYSSSSGFKADRTMSDALHETMAKVVERTPGYVLDCRPDDEAALVCAAAVMGDR